MAQAVLNLLRRPVLFQKLVLGQGQKLRAINLALQVLPSLLRLSSREMLPSRPGATAMAVMFLPLAL